MRAPTSAPALLAVSLLLAAMSARSEVGRLERLVMPGELVEDHAKYENQCEKCHDLKGRKSQAQLCRGCHDKIDADIRAGTGHHGRIKGIATMECRRCHTDHIGRKADIVMLDTGTFRHDLTDYPLEGAHRQLQCASCHAAGKKHRDAPRECVACHRKSDPHQGKLGRNCADCHNENSWKKNASEKFDHGRTRFPLRGKHQGASCESCHPAQHYKNVPRDCAGCHRVNDVHGGRYGSGCADCHTESRWKEVRFDHDRDTEYPLKGRHRTVICDACHTRNLHDKLQTACIACHREDDVHRGRNGTRCENCHDVNGWGKVQFDHNKDTRFPLRGRHVAVDCSGCHRSGARPEDAPTDCYGCHRSDDVHKGEFGQKCERCHDDRGWKSLTFDHDSDTKFPLHGAHKKTKCEACHIAGDFEKKLGTDCLACHKDDDVHEGQQGRQCDRCHSDESWKGNVRFEHDLTVFPLIGLHAVTPCEECHPQSTFKDTPKACVKCHQAKDVHRGALGENCEECHNPNDWRLWRFDHTTQTRFALDGAHAEVSCGACHTEPLKNRRELPLDCLGCHEQDDVHDGGFGPRCEQCHNTSSFEEVEIVR